jgi:hypothetical protein
MYKKGTIKIALLCLFILVFFVGCSTTPTKPEVEGIVFPSTIDEVKKAAEDALVVTGFDIEKSESQYIEGFRPRKLGFFVGSGGETVGVWLESLEPSRTRAIVKTAKSLVGYVGQKNWDDEIIAEMKNILKK